MQVAGIEAFGGEVRILDLAAPTPPAPDEVVISVHAAGVDNWDEIVRVGDWDVGRRPPLALGVETAGVVAAVGEEVTSFAPGDEVLTHPVPLRHQGAWAEWLVAPAALVARKPAAVPWEAAAAFPVPALTADQALAEVAPAPAGTWVLVHGAGGVTGGLAVQLAIARGATVVATAGPSSEGRVRGYGAHVVLDYHDPDWPDRVRDASPGGRGVGAAVNAARGGAATALQTVAAGGRLATITGDPPPPTTSRRPNVPGGRSRQVQRVVGLTRHRGGRCRRWASVLSPEPGVVRRREASARVPKLTRRAGPKYWRTFAHSACVAIGDSAGKSTPPAPPYHGSGLRRSVRTVAPAAWPATAPRSAAAASASGSVTATWSESSSSASAAASAASRAPSART